MNFAKRFFYKKRRFYDDDFDWENYTADSYQRRLRRDMEGQFHTSAEAGTLHRDADTGEVRSEGAPLHPNHALILEAIGRLEPGSVHEVGCGGGDHLANARALYPDLEVTGGDRGATQLELALRRHPALRGRIGIQDITMPFSDAWPRADLVYTQAVVMHIHTAVSHFVALANMARLARKYVLLMENQQCHNFVADMEALQAGGHLGWEKLHLYRYDGSAGARAMLMSKTPLDLPVLRSDMELRDGMKPSIRRLKRADEDSARGNFGFGRL